MFIADGCGPGVNDVPAPEAWSTTSSAMMQFVGGGWKKQIVSELAQVFITGKWVQALVTPFVDTACNKRRPPCLRSQVKEMGGQICSHELHDIR